MKGKNRTAKEKLFHDELAQLGCIACYIEGRKNTYVSIHHVNGRTKQGAHMQVLPLCGPHHQDQGQGVIAVHPWKARFEEKYGNQYTLIEQCKELINWQE